MVHSVLWVSPLFSCSQDIIGDIYKLQSRTVRTELGSHYGHNVFLNLGFIVELGCVPFTCTTLTSRSQTHSGTHQRTLELLLGFGQLLFIIKVIQLRTLCSKVSQHSATMGLGHNRKLIKHVS